MTQSEKWKGGPFAEILLSLQLENNKITLMWEDTSGGNEADKVSDDVGKNENDFHLVNHNGKLNSAHDDNLKQDRMLAQYKSVDPHNGYLTDKIEYATDTTLYAYLENMIANIRHSKRYSKTSWSTWSYQIKFSVAHLATLSTSQIISASNQKHWWQAILFIQVYQMFKRLVPTMSNTLFFDQQPSEFIFAYHPKHSSQSTHSLQNHSRLLAILIKHNFSLTWHGLFFN